MEGNLRGILGLVFSRAVAAAMEEEEQLFRRRDGIDSSICGCFEWSETEKEKKGNTILN